MAKYGTAFRDNAADDLSEWSPQWSGTIDDLELVQNHLPASPWLEATVSSGNRCWTWDVIDGDSGRADVRILALINTSSRFASVNTGGAVLAVRQSGTAGNENAYMLQLVPGSTISSNPADIRLRKIVAGTGTTLDHAETSGHHDHGVLVWVRFEVHGQDGQAVQRARCWGWDETEPTTWDVEAADTAISAAGGVAIGGTACVAVHELYVGTGGDEPPTPREFGRSLDALRDERDVKLEHVLKLARHPHGIVLNGTTSFGQSGGGFQLGSSSAEITIFARVRARGTSDAIVGKKDSFVAGTAGYALHVGSDGTARMIVSDGVDQAAIIGTAINDFGTARLWTRLDRAAELLRLRVDGTDVTPVTTAAVGSPSNSSAFRVGATATGTQFFDGEIDLIAIWLTCLSDVEIDEKDLTGDFSDADAVWGFHEGRGFIAYAESADPSVGDTYDLALTDVEWNEESETDWFSSRGRAATSAADVPPSTSMPALLLPPSTLPAALSGDIEFGREAARTTVLRLRNQRRSKDGDRPLDYLLSGNVAGREATLYTGEAGLWVRSFTRVVSGHVAAEPIARGDEIEIEIESAVGHAVNEPIDVRRYVGIPVGIRALTASNGLVTQTYDAAYDMAEFTIMKRHRQPLGSTANTGISRRQTNASNRNWSVAFQTSGPGGQVTVQWSEGGVTVGNVLSSVVSYADGLEHAWVIGVKGGSYAYIMVDGEVIDEAFNIGTPDNGAWDVTWGGGLPVGAEQYDARIYNQYIPPDLARAIFAQRVDGDSHEALVALVPMDDRTGTTATDYSPTANDGAVTGVEDTNFEWYHTDQGQAGLAGRPMPVTYGVPIGVPADEVDIVVDRFRYNDGDPPSDHFIIAGGDPDVRSRGELLTFSTDYTDEGDGVLEMVAATDVPVTLDVEERDDVNEPNVYVGAVVSKIAEERAPLISVDLREFALPVMSWQSQWHNRGQVPSFDQVLREIIGSSSGSWFQDRWGRLVGTALVPPVGPGPAGASWVESRGGSQTAADGGGIRLDGLANLASAVQDHSLGLLYRPTALPLASSDAGRFILLQYGGSLAIDARDGSVTYGAEGDLTPDLRVTGALQLGRTYLIVGQYLAGVNAFLSVYDIEAGTAAFDSVNPGFWSFSTTTHDLYACFAPGAYQWISAWSNAEPIQGGGNTFWGDMASDPAATVATLTGSEADLEVLIPFTDGRGPARELVYGCRVALGEGMRWCPRLSLDLRTGNSGVRWMNSPRALRPTRRVTVRYGRRWKPLQPADIAGTVLTDDIANDTSFYSDLQREWRAVDYDVPETLASYALTRDITVDSPLVQEKAAQRLARHLAWRYGPGMRVGRIDVPDHRWLTLTPTDEVRVYDRDHGLEDGQHFRAVTVGKEILLFGGIG